MLKTPSTNFSQISGMMLLPNMVTKFDRWSLNPLKKCCGALTYFWDRGYSRIDAMRAMEREWKAKAPLANIITCDGKPCVQIKGNEYTD
ncbi:MAG: hypothetical protein ACRC7P_00035, partial [Enterovibrio sp.]